jgi:hypothetical protein
MACEMRCEVRRRAVERGRALCREREDLNRSRGVGGGREGRLFDDHLRLRAGLGLRHTEPGPSTVSRDVALQWITTGHEGSLAHTVDALADFFTRYVMLRDRQTALWVAAWTLATWCYRAFRVFPYLSIRSAEKRCGKSRLLGLMARVCFNASPVTAHPTEAQLYRSAARTGGVQLFDDVETLRGDKDRFDALMTVLNVGFERGGVVTRLEKRGERFVEEPYEVYAPRVLAGIAGLTALALVDASAWAALQLHDGSRRTPLMGGARDIGQCPPGTPRLSKVREPCSSTSSGRVAASRSSPSLCQCAGTRPASARPQ